MLSKNPYNEQNIKEYKNYNQDKVLDLLENAQKSFVTWKNISIKNRIKIAKYMGLSCNKIITTYIVLVLDL